MSIDKRYVIRDILMDIDTLARPFEQIYIDCDIIKSQIVCHCLSRPLIDDTKEKKRSIKCSLVKKLTNCKIQLSVIRMLRQAGVHVAA